MINLNDKFPFKDPKEAVATNAVTQMLPNILTQFFYGDLRRQFAEELGVPVENVPDNYNLTNISHNFDILHYDNRLYFAVYNRHFSKVLGAVSIVNFRMVPLRIYSILKLEGDATGVVHPTDRASIHLVEGYDSDIVDGIAVNVRNVTGFDIDAIKPTAGIYSVFGTGTYLLVPEYMEKSVKPLANIFGYPVNPVLVEGLPNEPLADVTPCINPLIHISESQ